MLAGLCSLPNADVADRAWPIIEKNYERFATKVADTRSGKLWRPVEKLYKRAVALRPSNGTTGPRKDLNASMLDFSLDDRVQATSKVQGLDLSAIDGLGGLGQQPMSPDMWMPNSGTLAMNALPTDFDPSWMDWENFLVDFALPAETEGHMGSTS